MYSWAYKLNVAVAGAIQVSRRCLRQSRRLVSHSHRSAIAPDRHRRSGVNKRGGILRRFSCHRSGSSIALSSVKNFGGQV